MRRDRAGSGGRSTRVSSGWASWMLLGHLCLGLNCVCSCAFFAFGWPMGLGRASGHYSGHRREPARGGARRRPSDAVTRRAPRHRRAQGHYSPSHLPSPHLRGGIEGAGIGSGSHTLCRRRRGGVDTALSFTVNGTPSPLPPAERRGPSGAVLDWYLGHSGHSLFPRRPGPFRPGRSRHGNVACPARGAHFGSRRRLARLHAHRPARAGAREMGHGAQVGWVGEGQTWRSRP